MFYTVPATGNGYDFSSATYHPEDRLAFATAEATGHTVFRCDEHQDGDWAEVWAGVWRDCPEALVLLRVRVATSEHPHLPEGTEFRNTRLASRRLSEVAENTPEEWDGFKVSLATADCTTPTFDLMRRQEVDVAALLRSWRELAPQLATARDRAPQVRSMVQAESDRAREMVAWLEGAGVEDVRDLLGLER